MGGASILVGTVCTHSKEVQRTIQIELCSKMNCVNCPTFVPTIYKIRE